MRMSTSIEGRKLRMKLTKAETDFIKQQGVGRIATIGPDGMPHNVAVCPVYDRERVYVGSDKNASKVRNIEANPKAAIVFDAYRDSWKGLRGVMLRCTARLADEKDF